MKKPFFDSANFVPVPRVPEWPIYEPEHLPATWKKIAYIDNPRPVSVYSWNLYFDGAMLIFYRSKDTFNHFNGEPVRHINQFEFPIEAARWFVDNLPRFFKKPGEDGALTVEKFHLEGEAGGEQLKIARLQMTYGPGIAGYALQNLSRCEHPDQDLCQSFDMSDKFLFEEGMLELFKDIAYRHDNNLL